MDAVRQKENGLKHSKTVGDYVYTIQIKPAEFAALKELGKDFDVNELNQRINELQGLIYLDLVIARTDGAEVLKTDLTSEQEYYERVNFLSTFLKNFIRLSMDENSYAPVLYQFERSYGLVPYCTVVMAFEELEIAGSKKINIEFDDKMFSGELVQFSLKKSQILEAPCLKI